MQGDQLCGRQRLGVGPSGQQSLENHVRDFDTTPRAVGATRAPHAMCSLGGGERRGGDTGGRRPPRDLPQERRDGHRVGAGAQEGPVTWDRDIAVVGRVASSLGGEDGSCPLWGPRPLHRVGM